MQQNLPVDDQEFNSDKEPVRPKRKRIPLKKLDPLPPDPLEFLPNKCSLKARKVHAGREDFHYELWIDQHYQIRHQHGDDNGKREGIEPDVITNLIKRAFKHLLLYGSLIKGFVFINHENKSPVRLVLREETEFGMLNVPIEVHYLDINKFEITVKTAMIADNFRVQAGEYVVELVENGSCLKKSDNGKLSDVYSF